MNTIKRVIAATELALISPAALFMTALFVRNLQPQQYEPARTAQQIVTWYAARPRVGLWVLLIALPFAVLFIGLTTLSRCWSGDDELRRATRRMLADVRAHLAILLIAAATIAAGVVLVIVTVHVLTD